MAILTAQQMEEVRDRVSKWYAETRLSLIEVLEAGGRPYGHAFKTDEELLMEWQQMNSETWANMYEQMMARYRGLPDASKRAAKDMQRYRQRMEQLEVELHTQEEGVIYG